MFILDCLFISNKRLNNIAVYNPQNLRFIAIKTTTLKVVVYPSAAYPVEQQYSHYD